MLLAGWYFGLRLWGVLAYRGLRPRKIIFWPILAAVLALAFYRGSPLVATLLYGILLFGLGDLLGLILRVLGRPGLSEGLARLWQGGLTALAAALLITLLAWFNAHSPVPTAYTVAVDKDFGPLAGVTVTLLADVHLGTVVREADLPALVQRINDQAGDMIALCGDIFEEGTSPQLRAAAIAAFAGFKAPLGVFYVTGNHDSQLRPGEAEALAASGVTVLDDRVVLVADSFYVAGRRDSGHQEALTRQSAEALLQGVDRSRPILVLDHRPAHYGEAAAAGADLQLSGHTHAGQLFPLNLLSGWANKVGYGHVQEGDFNIIVTSGYGVWGFPVRTGSRCEYVTVQLTPAG